VVEGYYFGMGRGMRVKNSMGKVIASVGIKFSAVTLTMSVIGPLRFQRIYCRITRFLTI